MRDNNILDQLDKPAAPINTGKLQKLYRLLFANFGIFYGFLLFGIYKFRSIEFQNFLGIESRRGFKYTIYVILGIAVLSFLAGVFFRLRYDYFSPLKTAGESGKAAGRYFVLAVAIFVLSWLSYYTLSAETIGDLIGFKKRGTNSEFGLFSLYFCWGLTGLYTLLAGLRLVQAAKKRQKTD